MAILAMFFHGRDARATNFIRCSGLPQTLAF
jgi:hypothetical protein